MSSSARPPIVRTTWASETLYYPIGPAARRQGLEWGGYWPGFRDLPHVQLPLDRKGISTEALRRAHLRGGKKAVYRLLNTRNWSR